MKSKGEEEGENTTRTGYSASLFRAFYIFIHSRQHDSEVHRTKMLPHNDRAYVVGALYVTTRKRKNVPREIYAKSRNQNEKLKRKMHRNKSIVKYIRPTRGTESNVQPVFLDYIRIEIIATAQSAYIMITIIMIWLMHISLVPWDDKTILTPFGRRCIMRLLSMQSVQSALLLFAHAMQWAISHEEFDRTIDIWIV